MIQTPQTRRIKNPWRSVKGSPEYYVVPAEPLAEDDRFLFYGLRGAALAVCKKTGEAVSNCVTVAGFLRGIDNPHSPIGRGGHRMSLDPQKLKSKGETTP